jgi:triphosphoribosyl-dephospho-CoA synthase
MPPEVGLCAQLACVWEATARKPGNVHRYRDFDDVTYLDFLVSAAAIAPVLTAARHHRVGETVFECVRATRQVAATNTNLGIILLLAPLATVPDGEELRSGVGRVLAGLDVADARRTYEAIRLAMPGGLGVAPEQDVAAEPTCTLRQAMEMAADRDAIARQYANGFREVFKDGVPALTEGLQQTGSLEAAIIRAQLHLMARHPDTLIARKRGQSEAAKAAELAVQVLAARWPEQESARRKLGEFDDWLREEKHSRNPGATADLITASLFVAIRTEAIPVNPRFPMPATAPYHFPPAQPPGASDNQSS